MQCPIFIRSSKCICIRSRTMCGSVSYVRCLGSLEIKKMIIVCLKNLHSGINNRGDNCRSRCRVSNLPALVYTSASTFSTSSSASSNHCRALSTVRNTRERSPQRHSEVETMSREMKELCYQQDSVLTLDCLHKNQAQGETQPLVVHHDIAEAPSNSVPGVDRNPTYQEFHSTQNSNQIESNYPVTTSHIDR